MAADRDSGNLSTRERVRLERIVIGVDFSAPSVAAAGWARRHLAPDADCVIVHAPDVPRPPRFLRGAFPSRDEVLKSAQAGAAARLERLREEEQWGAVKTEVRDGRALSFGLSIKLRGSS